MVLLYERESKWFVKKRQKQQAQNRNGISSLHAHCGDSVEYTTYINSNGKKNYQKYNKDVNSVNNNNSIINKDNHITVKHKNMQYVKT